jgi:CHAP domain
MLFPLTPPRGLALTSPLTKGNDVKQLQQACSIWAKAHQLPTIAEDGVYGPDTDHEVQVVAYDMGLRYLRAMRATIRLIYHPWMRTPADLLRAKQRAKQRPKGIAALPVIAAKYIGVRENPMGSNWGKPHPADWEQACGFTYGPWCAAFASAVIREGGGHVAEGYCPTIVAHAQARIGGFDAWTSDHRQAGPGWLVLYTWTGGQADHVGIVESFTATGLVAIEGNENDQVMRKTRTFAPVLGFARPRL